MLIIVSWMLIALGIGHIVYGLLRFRMTIGQAIAEGWIGRFTQGDERRLAFWFLIFGPLLAMGGHAALHAAATGDTGLVRIVGCYLFGVCLAGVTALPKSPMWAGLLLAPLLLAKGYGWL